MGPAVISQSCCNISALLLYLTGERWMGPAVISQSYPRSPRIHLIQDNSLRRIPGKPVFVSLYIFCSLTRKRVSTSISIEKTCSMID